MISKTIPGDTTMYDVDNSHEELVLEQGATLTGATIGIYEGEYWHENIFKIDGSLKGSNSDNVGAGIAIRGFESSVAVGATGAISGYNGVRLYGDSQSVINEGIITGQLNGISSLGSNVKIINNGTISGDMGLNLDGRAISINGSLNAEIVNNGIINGEMAIDADDIDIMFGKTSIVNNGIDVHTDPGDKSLTVNLGVINMNSSGWGANCREGDDVLINKGVINGGIVMGLGADLFDNRGGTFSGDVYGDAGDDIFIVDTTTVKIREVANEGHDTVKSTVSYSFMADLIKDQELEDLILLGRSKINATGNDLDNMLLGNRGRNKLFGMDGNDDLCGGKGSDVLKGGAGADVFHFQAKLGTEIVVDFQDGVDHILFAKTKHVTSINDLIKHHAHDVGKDLVISGDGTELILRHMHKADLDASDFIM